MISFKKITIRERVLCLLWPPYRRKMDAKTEAAIKFLVEHPEAPCQIGGTFIPDGYGTSQPWPYPWSYPAIGPTNPYERN